MFRGRDLQLSLVDKIPVVALLIHARAAESRRYSVLYGSSMGTPRLEKGECKGIFQCNPNTFMIGGTANFFLCLCKLATPAKHPLSRLRAGGGALTKSPNKYEQSICYTSIFHHNVLIPQVITVCPLILQLAKYLSHGSPSQSD